jgi:hypothetical protein
MSLFDLDVFFFGTGIIYSIQIFIILNWVGGNYHRAISETMALRE